MEDKTTEIIPIEVKEIEQDFKNEDLRRLVRAYLLTKKPRSKYTRENYRSNLAQFVDWIETNKIDVITEQTLIDYQTALKDGLIINGELRKYTAGTQRQRLQAIKNLFSWANKKGILPFDLTIDLKLDRAITDKHKRKAFTLKEFWKILDSIDTSNERGARDYAIIRLAYAGALRIIEIHRANIEDLNSNSKTLIVMGKGHQEKDQEILLDEDTLKAIKYYLTFRPSTKPREALFVNCNRSKMSGQRITEKGLSRLLKQRIKDAGIDDRRYTPHSIRHTSITEHYKAENDLYRTQKFARHTDPKVTEIYIDEVESGKINNANILADALKRAKEENE